MTTLESDKVDRALSGKMKAERHDSGDWYYIVRNAKGIAISSTSISKGAKHTLGHNRVSQMARQLHLNKPQLLVDLVSCVLKREDVLEIMEANSSP
ncbi:MAG TPA: hypothetical protein VFB12_21840 [Ktedonobacteraceae bacterium]|nr:hypothetical protein [Ktedonobacteraceae bacterium]